MKNTLKPVLLIFTLAISNVIAAQHDHSSHGEHSSHEMEAPNGGELKMIGKYHIEIVANMLYKKDPLKFYLLKQSLKPVKTEGVIGKCTITHKDGTTYTQVLNLRDLGYYGADVKQTDEFKCEIEFVVKGKTIKTFFFYNNN